MLELKDIVKIYGTEDNKVNALRGVSIDFRENELVSILGPSGCGKTTLLNIIGGLDKYTSGDLIINDKSTKDFTDRDWDAYRNQRIGFVFQNYNLIPHLSVLGNVEMSLTLSGIPSEERRVKAIKALEVVGLSDQIKKRPNQLSGGQMQRVAIARAIVNNPDIILADEPTGALDSTTSVQVMDILKDLAKDRLVIMVTHNNNLAKKYSTRIIEFLDGEIIKDTMPYNHTKTDTSSVVTKKVDLIKQKAVEDISANIDQNKDSVADDDIDPNTDVVVNNNGNIVKKGKNKKDKKKNVKTSMSFFTAFNLSLKNLFSKRTRTILTSFAGSIGIIGVALVLAVSNGFNNYINKLQSNTLSGYPISISTISVDMDLVMDTMSNMNNNEKESFPDEEVIYVKDRNVDIAQMAKYSFISPKYLEYLQKYKTEDSKKPESSQTLNDIVYSYGTPMVVLGKSGNTYKNISDTELKSSAIGAVTSNYFTEGLNSKEFVTSQYDVLYGSYPDSYNELALVIGSTNELSTTLLDTLAIDYTRNADGTINNINFSDLVTTETSKGKEYKLIYNNDYYKPNLNNSQEIVGFIDSDKSDFNLLYNSPNALTLTISGIFRVKPDAALSVYNNGLIYTPMLTEHFRENAKQSTIVQMQRENIYANFNRNFYNPYTITVSGVTNSFKNPTELKTIIKAMFGYDLTTEQIYQYSIQQYGASDIPNNIYIYPKSFEAKDKIINYLEAWNNNPENALNKVYYTDATAILSGTMGEMVNIISYVLIAFASISLVVSSIMIGIITYVSVVERTKEIGVLRALGARKKDIRRVFNAETLIIGFTAGVIGVLVSVLLTIPISLIIANLSSGMVSNIAKLTLGHGISLIVISMVLTLISGLVPAQLASKKDPVVALRTE